MHKSKGKSELTNLNFYINLLKSTITFIYPLKTSENHRFSDTSRGYRNETLSENGLK